MKPTNSESADQKGYEAFCVSGRGWNPCEARLLIHSRDAPDPSAATITSRRPSGDTANRDSALRASMPPASCMPAGNTTEEMIAGASATGGTLVTTQTTRTAATTIAAAA